VSAHKRSRLRSWIAGAPVCRCGRWLDLCQPETTKPAPGWDGPTMLLPLPLVSEAPVLTLGQAARVEHVCRDMR
jgi:hypothetical protein